MQKRIRHSLKSLEDVHMRRPKTYFDTVLWRLMSPNLKKNTKIHTIHVVICHWDVISHNDSDRPILKKSRGRPHVTSFNIFCNSFRKIAVQKSPKTLNYIQFRLLFVTGMQYQAIKVIGHSIKNPKDVPMWRPSTYFETALDRFMSKNLPKHWIIYNAGCYLSQGCNNTR